MLGRGRGLVPAGTRLCGAPAYADAITILVDDDEPGWRGSSVLADDLRARGLHTDLVCPNRVMMRAP